MCVSMCGDLFVHALQCLWACATHLCGCVGLRSLHSNRLGALVTQLRGIAVQKSVVKFEVSILGGRVSLQ